MSSKASNKMHSDFDNDSDRTEHKDDSNIIILNFNRKSSHPFYALKLSLRLDFSKSFIVYNMLYVVHYTCYVSTAMIAKKTLLFKLVFYS